MVTQNLKLRNRLLLGYSVPIVLFMALAGIVYESTNRLNSAFSEVERTREVIELANTMSLSHARMSGASRGYLFLQDQYLISEYDQWQQKFKTADEDVMPLIIRPEQKERLNQMIQLQKDYNDFSQKLFNLIRQGKQDEAIELIKTSDGQRLVDKFKDVSEEFNKNEKDYANKATKAAQEVINNLIGAVIIGALLCLGLSILIALLISSGITQTVNQAVNAIASSSTEIASTVEEQERITAHQAASVNQTTTTMDELGASSRQAAQQAESAATGAQQALSLAATGNEAVEDTLEGMSQLRTKVGAISSQIIRLSEQTNQIGSISNLVSDLANQTNMLALNAAVEAVRAGEHGKGFGVVATEIRKLADQSKKSAEKINILVADIQNAINTTVIATDEGTQTVETGVKIAQRTADAFTGVTEAINNVVLSNQQISLNAKQQAIAIQQVVEAMNALNQAASQTATGISQTRVGTQKLNEAAQSLKAVV